MESSTSFYSNQYPRISNSLEMTQSFFEAIKDREVCNAESELEIRLGRIEDGRFQNGVSHIFLNQAIMMLQTYSGWDSVSEWVQCVDYFYDDASGNTIRTRVYADKDPMHIQKTVERTADFKMLDDAGSPLKRQFAPGAFRIQLAVETNTEPTELFCVPKLVRIKQRKSFTYGRQWRFDMSKVWSGKTFNEADRLLHCGVPTSCECEIEYIGHGLGFQNSYGHSPVFLAVSLLLKVLDFFPSHSYPSLHFSK